jgi:serine/threonine protein kinase
MVSDVSGSEALLAVNDEALASSLTEKGVDGEQLSNLADQVAEVRQDLLNNTRTYDRPIWNAADASMPAVEDLVGRVDGRVDGSMRRSSLETPVTPGTKLADSLSDLSISKSDLDVERQLSQQSSWSSVGSVEPFRNSYDDCTIEIHAGSLGINIFECIEHNPAYRVQFNYFTGTSDAEQLAAGKLKEGMSLTHVNGDDQIGLSYKEIVSGLGVRPCKLRFEESDFSRKVTAEINVRVSMARKKPRLTMGGFGNAATAVSQRFRVKSKAPEKEGTKASSARRGSQDIGTLVRVLAEEAIDAGAGLNYMTLKSKLRGRMTRELREEEKAALTQMLIQLNLEEAARRQEEIVDAAAPPASPGRPDMHLMQQKAALPPPAAPSPRPQLQVPTSPPPIPAYGGSTMQQQEQQQQEQDQDRKLLSQPLVDLGIDHVPVFSCPVANDYALGQELGSGSFCSVRVGKERPHLAGRGSFLNGAAGATSQNRRISQGSHFGLGALRAIKIFDRSPKALVQSEREQVSYELLLLAQASACEYVVRLFSVYETPATLCMVTELCRGGEVFQTVADKGAFPEAMAVHMMRCLMTALEYLHVNQRVVHRDVKLENMLLSRPADAEDFEGFRQGDSRSSTVCSSGTAGQQQGPLISPLICPLICKLADFGLARRLSPVQEGGQVQVGGGGATSILGSMDEGATGSEGTDELEFLSMLDDDDGTGRGSRAEQMDGEEDYDDFDVSAELEQRNTLCGSGDYIAPEVFKRNGYGLKVRIVATTFVRHTLTPLASSLVSLLHS